MGRLLVILLVMLMPLRGWSAERMAVQMASIQSAMAMPADCPMVLQADSKDEVPSRAPQSHSTFQTCQACQLCTSLASQDMVIFNVTAPPPQAPLDLMHVRFISADLARHAKPPIL